MEKWYYKNGELLKETPYVNGEMHGLVKEYLQDGQIWFETLYVDGKTDGVEKKENKGMSL